MPFFAVLHHNVSIGSILLNSYVLKNMAGVLPEQFEPIYNPSKLVQEHYWNSSDEEPPSVSC